MGCTTMVQAQMAIDTTSLKYGARTTRFRTERDIFLGRDTTYAIDSSLNRLHQQEDYVFSDAETPMKNLGNLGTAMQPIFWQAPDRIGTRLGIDIYDAYRITPQTARYWNTQSPYSKLFYTQGRRGRQQFEGIYSRNITNRSNATIVYKRITSQKQFGQIAQEEREADHNSIQVNGNHISKDGRFLLLGYYHFMYHRVNETGGIWAQKRDTVNGVFRPDSLFDFQVQRIQLNATARTIQKANNWHIYTQYHLGKSANSPAVYFSLDRNIQQNSFLDLARTRSSLYRKTSVFSVNADGRDTIYSEINYRYHQYQAGFKQNTGGLFYTAYAQYRTYDFEGNKANQIGPERELLIGGEASFKFRVWGVKLLGEIIPGRDFRLEGILSGKNWNLKAQSLRLSPTQMQLSFRGSYFNWDSDLPFTLIQRFEASGNWQFGRFKMFGKAQTAGIINYIYWDAASKPQSENNLVSLNTLMLGGQYNSPNFGAEIRGFFAGTAGPRVINMPSIMAETDFFFKGKLFGKPLPVRAGIYTRTFSTWYGDYYNPVIQQFYLQPNQGQGRFALYSFPEVQPYITLFIRRAQVFAKMHNALQGIGRNGYFVTPWQPGANRIIQFGVFWHFYD